MRRRVVVRLSALAGLISMLIFFPTSTLAPHRQSAQAAIGVQNMLRGFDKCNAPGTGTMNNWFNNSPYAYIGIYIGGVNRACDNTDLTSSWVSTVSNQEWSFMPTYVGLQDPCIDSTLGDATFSTNSGTAQSQGANDADFAISRAQNLGFTDSIIYFDLEGWGGTGGNCLSSAEAFVKGWSSELQSQGWTAGLYGSAGSSDMSNMYDNVSPRPQDAWIAGGSSANSPWDISGVPNGNWEDDHRIHQYHFDGSASEDCHGGICLQVDRNCAIGPTAKAWSWSVENSEPAGSSESDGPAEDVPPC